MSEKKRGKGWLSIRRPGPKTWVRIGLIVLVGGWLLNEHWKSVEREVLSDRYSDDPLKYEKLGPPAFYRLTFRAMFDGAPVEIVRVGECRPYLASGGMGGGYSIQYVVVPPYAGQRLPDGSAYYIKMPNYCSRMRGGNSSERWQVAGMEEVLPQGFWVDDFKAPTLVEAYVTAAYFEQPEARVKFVKGQVEFLALRPESIPQGGEADAVLGKPGPTGVTLGESRERFVWARGARLIPVDPRWRGLLNAPPIAVSAGGRFKFFDQRDADYDPDLVTDTTRLFYNVRGMETYIAQLRRGLPLSFPEDMLRGLSQNIVDEMRIAGELYGAMMPLRPTGDKRFVVETQLRGYEIRQASPEPRKNLERFKGMLTFVIDGNPVEVDVTNLNGITLFFLDTQDDRVYAVKTF